MNTTSDSALVAALRRQMTAVARTSHGLPAMTPAPAAVGTAITVSPTVTFPDGIPGFESCRRWVVMPPEAATPLRRMDAFDGMEASFLAIDPRAVLEGYRCELSAADRVRLAARDNELLLWLALIMMDSSGALTVNLRAPIVINPRTMTGQQVLPHNCLYPLRHFLVPAPSSAVLVFTRRKYQAILSGCGAEMRVVSIEKEGVRPSIAASAEVRVRRREIYDQIGDANHLAVVSPGQFTQLADRLEKSRWVTTQCPPFSRAEAGARRWQPDL